VRRETIMRAAYGMLTLGILALDQTTKALVTSRMALYSSIPVVQGLFHLTYVTNRGALFGLFRDMAEPFRAALFTSVPTLAIVLIVVFQCRTTIVDTAAQSGLALILGGALGNLLDRLRFGYVVDFLDVFFGDHHWRAFNVADASFCAGVGLLLLDLLVKGRDRRSADVAPEA